MDFSLSEEQKALKESVVKFARAELADEIESDDQDSAFPREKWRKCAEFGVQGSAVPVEMGGSGLSAVDTMLTMEALGYGCADNGLLFGLNAQMWSVQQPLVKFATAAQRDRYLPALLQGRILGAHGMTEPESGSDAYALKTQAVKVEGGYRLTGAKTMITNAPVADLCIVFATTNPKAGRWGISAFLVEKGAPGLTIGANTHKMGLRTSPLGDLYLDDCFVAEDQRLGPEGAGGAIFHDSMEWERACILGAHVGAMERQLERCVEHARRRRQSGRSISKFQAVSHRIADMKVRLETARLLLYRVAWQKAQGLDVTQEAAMAKLYLSEVFIESSLDAIRIHGGYGYMSEMGVERDLRDSVGGVLYSGTSDIQRNIIAAFLGL